MHVDVVYLTVLQAFCFDRTGAESGLSMSRWLFRHWDNESHSQETCGCKGLKQLYRLECTAGSQNV